MPVVFQCQGWYVNREFSGSINVKVAMQSSDSQVVSMSTLTSNVKILQDNVKIVT